MLNLWNSLVRTVVPVIVGAVLSLLVQLGLEPDPAVAEALSAVLFGGATALYYVVARLLEHYVSPRFGWLLGKPSKPEYTGSKE